MRNLYFSVAIITVASLVAGGFVAQTIFAANLSSQVVVATSIPTVSGVAINNGTPITLTAATTTAISVNATITDANGCGEITGGTSTIVLYRSGIPSSTCMAGANPLDCYVATVFTASSTCAGGTQTATTTFAVQYFAQATDASSSFSAQNWLATVIFKTADNTTGTADAGGVELNTLTAISVTTSSINYGALTANTNTGSTDQLTVVANAGDSSSSLQLAAQSTLVSGVNSIATSSQAFSTSTFTYPGTSTALTGSNVAVSGFLLTSPTSSTNVTSTIYWGLLVPNSTPTGTYTGTNSFTALWHA